jgi:hypothetical protein
VLLKKIILSVVFILCCMSLLAEYEDQKKWHFVDGSIIIGSFVEDGSDYIIIKTKYGNKRIPKSDLKIIVITITTKDDSTIIGDFVGETLGYVIVESKVGRIKIDKKQIVSYEKNYKDGKDSREDSVFGKKEKFSRGYSDKIEPLIDIFFDPTGYTFEEGDIYLSGLSLAYGYSDTFLFSVNLINFAGLNDSNRINPNIELKKQLIASRGGRYDYLLSLGFRGEIHSNNGKKVKYYNRVQKEDSKGEKYFIYEKGSFIKEQIHRPNASIDSDNKKYTEEEKLIGWKTQFYIANTWSFIKERGGRVNYHLGMFLNVNHMLKYKTWLQMPTYKVYAGFDVDMSRSFKLLGEIFYDPNYAFLFSAQDELGVDFGILWSYSETFRILVHLKPYFLGFYWRF